MTTNFLLDKQDACHITPAFETEFASSWSTATYMVLLLYHSVQLNLHSLDTRESIPRWRYIPGQLALTYNLKVSRSWYRSHQASFNPMCSGAFPYTKLRFLSIQILRKSLTIFFFFFLASPQGVSSRSGQFFHASPFSTVMHTTFTSSIFKRAVLHITGSWLRLQNLRWGNRSAGRIRNAKCLRGQNGYKKMVNRAFSSLFIFFAFLNTRLNKIIEKGTDTRQLQPVSRPRLL